MVSFVDVRDWDLHLGIPTGTHLVVVVVVILGPVPGPVPVLLPSPSLRPSPQPLGPLQLTSITQVQVLAAARLD